MVTHISIIETEGGYEWFAYNHQGLAIARSPVIYTTIHEANHGAMILRGDCIHGALMKIMDTTTLKILGKNNSLARREVNRLATKVFRTRKSGRARDDEPMEGWGDR